LKKKADDPAPRRASGTATRRLSGGATRRGSGGAGKYSFMYEVGDFVEGSDSSQAPIGKGQKDKTERRLSPQMERRLSLESNNGLLNTNDVPIRLVARELHTLLWYDAPIKNVLNILYQYPEVLNDRTFDPYGFSPLEVSITRAMNCVCGCCNYNRNKVIAALNKGVHFYKQHKNEHFDNTSTDGASNICNASTNTKARKRHNINGHYPTNDTKGKINTSLTTAALKQREAVEFQMYSNREAVWIKHAPKFSKLHKIITELQREKYLITTQLDDKNEQIKNLNTNFVTKEENLSFFEKLSSSRFNDKLATSYFKIGMANLDKSKLKASLLEVEINMEKARRDLTFLESVSFDGIDNRLRQMFGQSSLRNCGILNEINTVAPDNRVQQIEKLKYRFL